MAVPKPCLQRILMKSKPALLQGSASPFGFALRATLLSVLFLGFYLIIPHHVLKPVVHSLAVLVAELLRTIGVDVVRNGNLISSPQFSIKIINECLGIEPVLLAGAFIIVYPGATPKSRLFAFASAVPVLTATNLVRIIAIFMISSWNIRLFEICHIYLGQCLMLIATAGLFLLWISTIDRSRTFTGKRVFFFRLVIASSVLFILWIFLQKPYASLTEFMLTSIMKLFTGHATHFADKPNYDYTFSIVTFLALLAAEHPMPWKERLRAALLGGAILFSVHCLFRITAIISFLEKSSAAYSTSVGIYAFLTILLPLLLWLTIRAGYQKRAATTCPYCGVVKTEIANHIRVKHPGCLLPAKR